MQILNLNDQAMGRIPLLNYLLGWPFPAVNGRYKLPRIQSNHKKQHLVGGFNLNPFEKY